jgi:hypothetical protein
LVDDEDFATLVEYLRPQYAPPSRRRLERNLLPALSKYVTDRMTRKMNDIATFSLTTDSWTSGANRGYIAITAHGITKDWSFESFFLDLVPVRKSETAEYLSEIIEEVLLDWDIGRQARAACTTDGAANVRSAVMRMHMPWVYCIAHALNRSIRLGLKNAVVKPLMKKAKHIVRLFKSSPKAARMLEEKQAALHLPVQKMKLDNKTRWGSAYEMLERLRVARPAVAAWLGTLQGTRRTVPPDLTHDEWSHLADLAMVLRPLKEATEFLSQRKHPTVGAILPLLNRVCAHHLAAKEDDPEQVATFKREVNRDLNERWNLFDGEVVDDIVLSVYLDPRVKHFSFVRDAVKRNELLKKAYRLIEQWLRKTTDQSGSSINQSSSVRREKEKEREHAGPSTERPRRPFVSTVSLDSPSPPINRLIRLFGEDLIEPDERRAMPQERSAQGPDKCTSYQYDTRLGSYSSIQ